MVSVTDRGENFAFVVVVRICYSSTSATASATPTLQEKSAVLKISNLYIGEYALNLFVPYRSAFDLSIVLLLLLQAQL